MIGDGSFERLPNGEIKTGDFMADHPEKIVAGLSVLSVFAMFEIIGRRDNDRAADAVRKNLALVSEVDGSTVVIPQKTITLPSYLVSTDPKHPIDLGNPELIAARRKEFEKSNFELNGSPDQVLYNLQVYAEGQGSVTVPVTTRMVFQYAEMMHTLEGGFVSNAKKSNEPPTR